MSGDPGSFGPYTLLGELGRGGMGVVYRARHEELGSEVALKVISGQYQDDPGVIARFQREARSAAKLAGHPGIVGVHDVGDADGRLYLIMDYVQGRALDEVIEEGELTPEQIATIVEQVARAVHHAHTQGVLHRDIKPGNILIDAQGQPHVTDFGLAQTRAVDGPSRRLTQSGEMLGTPSYMPPEQARGESLDGRADVYALGATLFAACTGRPPFDSPSMHGVLQGLLTEPPPPLRRLAPHAPAALEAIAERCLAKRPDDRYPTADALADDLARYLRGEPVQARSIGALERFRRGMGRRRALVGAAVTLALAGAAGWWVWEWSVSESQHSTAADVAGDLAAGRAQRMAAWFDLAATTSAPMGVLEDTWQGRPAAPGDVAEALAAVEAACGAHTTRFPASRLAPAWRRLARVYASAEPAGEAESWLAPEQREADPYVELVEARYWLGRYCRDLLVTGFRVGAGADLRDEFKESERQARERSLGVRALRRALAAPELQAAAGAAALHAFGDGANAVSQGRWAAAEQPLSRASSDATFGGLAGVLQGTALFHLKRYDEAASAWTAGADRGWGAALRNTAGGWVAASDVARARGDDPEPYLLRAESVAADPVGPPEQRAWLVRIRIMARWTRGRWRAETGGDPFEPWGRALDDIAEFEQVAPGTVGNLAMRAAVLTQMGRTQYRRGDDGEARLREAIAAHDLVVEAEPADMDRRRERGDAWRELAAGLHKRGSDPAPAIAAALQDLNAAVAGLPKDPVAPRLRGIVRLLKYESAAPTVRAGARPMLDRALGDLLKAVELFPGLATSHFDLGRGYAIASGHAALAGRDGSTELALAVDAFREAVRLNPRDAAAWFELARMHVRFVGHAERAGASAEAHVDAAMKAFDGAMTANPSRWDVLEERGRALVKYAESLAARGKDGRARAREAVQAHDAAIALDGAPASAWAYRGDAVRALAVQRAAHGADPTALLAEALADTKRAIAMDPDLALGHNTFGVVAVTTARMSSDPAAQVRLRLEAVAAFGIAAQLRPDWPYPVMNRAAARLNLGRLAAGRGEDPVPQWSSGAAELAPLIARSPDLASAWANRALLHFELAKWDGRNRRDPRPMLVNASRDAQGAIRCAPSEPNHRLVAAQIESELGFAVSRAGGDGDRHWDQAALHGKEALRVYPNWWKANLVLGQICAAQGELEDSLRHLEAAAKAEPGNPGIERAVAQIKQALGR